MFTKFEIAVWAEPGPLTELRLAEVITAGAKSLGFERFDYGVSSKPPRFALEVTCDGQTVRIEAETVSELLELNERMNAPDLRTRADFAREADCPNIRE